MLTGNVPDGIHFAVEDAYKYERRKKLLDELAELGDLGPPKENRHQPAEYITTYNRTFAQNRGGSRPAAMDMDDTSVSWDAPDFFHVPTVKRVGKKHRKFGEKKPRRTLEKRSHGSRSARQAAAVDKPTKYSKVPATGRNVWGEDEESEVVSGIAIQRQRCAARAPARPARKQTGLKCSVLKSRRQPCPFLINRVF